MIKAIIFDCFDVLVGNSIEPFKQKYFADDPVGQQKIDEMDQRANRGELSYLQLLQALATFTDISIDDVRVILDDNPINTALLDYIEKKLRPHYKIGILSNASDDWMDEFFTPTQKALFDDIVLSFRHAIAKPDLEIYQLSANRLGIAPNECIFIDDKRAYCDGAEKAGMHTIQYTDFVQMKSDLESSLELNPV